MSPRRSPRRRTRKPFRASAPARAFAALGTGAALLTTASGCDSPRREVPFPGETPRAEEPRHSLPHAFLVRFQDVRGTGFDRESWELEVLQMGSDIRVRGTLRTGGRSIPVYRPMDQAEFRDFWSWIREYPLDGFRVEEDAAQEAAEWRKRLKFDAVLGPDLRWLSENEWTRPPVGAPWLQAVENRLHVMMIELAENELDRQETEGPEPDETGAGVQRALEALGDAEPTNLPGGSPGGN